MSKVNPVRCQACDANLSEESTSQLKAPCPKCGSTSRVYTETSLELIGFSVRHRSLLSRPECAILFEEGGDGGPSTIAELQQPNQLHLEVWGTAPQGEDGTLGVGRLLITKLN